LRELAALAHKEDPSRRTTFADCCEEENGVVPSVPALAGSTDVMGYNRYYGWYYDKAQDFGAKMDHFHAKHPDIPISVSEYGAGGAVLQHSDNVLGGPINAFGRPHPEEYQSYYHEEVFKQLKTRPYIFADWVWNMFDFVSDLRAEGDSSDLNDKGLVTFDRKIKKDAYYFYKANLNPAPMIYLTSRRYVDRAYPVMDVKAYTTAPRATLRVNGAAAGTVDCPDHICIWPGIALRAGANKVVAQGGGVSDTVTWNGPDVRAAGLHLDAGNIAGHVSADGTRYGSDTFFEGGEARALNIAGFGAYKGLARKLVTGATDTHLFDYYRVGDFSYSLPLPDGRWQVTIRSFEPVSGLAATRSFDVLADGTLVLSHVMPGAEAGGALKAVARTFPVTVSGGQIRLAFKSVGGPAILAAIDVVRAP
ncbi:MAG: beta-galactosidase, partial [Alphaproteobacteria bacterium]|nr:beta-galactosidase [Alphaproteobacteria bacterium]